MLKSHAVNTKALINGFSQANNIRKKNLLVLLPHLIKYKKLTDLQLPSNVETCPYWLGPKSTRWSGSTALTSATFLWRPKGCFPLGQEVWLEWGQYDKQVWGLFPTHQGAKYVIKFFKKERGSWVKLDISFLHTKIHILYKKLQNCPH